MTRDIFAEVTNQIVTALEGGIVPWVRPWQLQGDHRNLASGRAYQGVNAFLLNITAATRGYASPYWITYRQAQDLGGNVRAGEKSTQVVFWKIMEKPTGDVDEKGEPKLARIPLLKHYNVFNVEQCTLPEGSVPAPEIIAGAARDEAAEKIWANYVDAARVAHGGAQAYYVPALDKIQLPKRESFRSTEGYYHVLFHEAIHSTGHEARLNRATLTQAGSFGSENYSQEELVAELGAAMLLAQAGMTPMIENSAAYIRGWLRALRDDKKLVVIAAQQAQKAATWILDVARSADAGAPVPANAYALEA